MIAGIHHLDFSEQHLRCFLIKLCLVNHFYTHPFCEKKIGKSKTWKFLRNVIRKKGHDSYLIKTRQMTNVNKTTFCQSMNCHFNAAEVSLADIPLDLVKPNSMTQAQISKTEVFLSHPDHVS